MSATDEHFAQMKARVEAHPVIVTDADGKEMARIKRQFFKRATMQAAADHKLMDAFAAQHPEAAAAVIGRFRFVFVTGRSRWSGEKFH